ncbi:rod shape-determining protein [Paraburkholderia caribensis MBA4]|uniref:Rod shape-determining protein n=1 Tax=Paraburkholderia caribensis MBA4 TaxID=1323664 RepID=A0A0P0RF74_9BURK|nr:rod shape-determining protein [Paraburkholderia caribensis MBA4]
MLHALRFGFFGLCAGIRDLFACFTRCGSVFSAFALASANCYRASSVAPVRGGTYFSLPPQRKVGKRKRLTPPALILA